MGGRMLWAAWDGELVGGALYLILLGDLAYWSLLTIVLGLVATIAPSVLRPGALELETESSLEPQSSLVARLISSLMVA
jgi:hypothetical protein